jgi:hypothetical protein
MKLPGVSGVYDYAGPDRNSRYRPRPCCLPPMQKRQRPDCIFSELNTQPTCTPVYASSHTSRWATQNSGPSGSLLLSRRTLAFPASCRFIPAHCIGDLTLPEIQTHCNFRVAEKPAQISQLLTRGLSRPLEKRPQPRDELEFQRWRTLGMVTDRTKIKPTRFDARRSRRDRC